MLSKPSKATYPKSWYQFDSKLAQYINEEGFEWTDKPSVGKGIGDSDYYEYHPSWPGLKGARSLPGLRDKAMQEAAQKGNYNLPANPKSLNWLKEMWKDAGAPCLSP
jgi:hypothetical protein